MKPTMRPFVLVAALALLADSPVMPRGPRLPTIVAAGDAQAPVVAAAATAQFRAAASRTAVVVAFDAGSGQAENDSRAAAVRGVLLAAAPGAEVQTRAFPTAVQPRQLGQLGGRVALVVRGTAATATRLVAGAIRPFRFARISGVESDPPECATALAAADANARGAARALAAAGAAALGWDLGEPTASENRTVLASSTDSSMLCRGDAALVTYALDGNTAADDRSALRASYALAFRALRKRGAPAGAGVAGDIEYEPALPRWFPRDVALVVRQRAIAFVGTASAPVPYAGDLVTYASQTPDDPLRDRVRALGVTDVRTLVTGDGEALLAVRVPRDGAVKAGDVVRAIRAAAGERARYVGSAPYADCTRRDAELVAAAVREARRRAAVVAGALQVPFGGPASLLVSEPISYTDCTSGDAPVRRAYAPAAQVLSGAPERNAIRSVAVAVVFPLPPVAPLAAGQPLTQWLLEDDPLGRPPDDLTALVRPARSHEVATTTSSRPLDARRVDLDIADSPDAANAFRAVDAAAVERAVAPWIAGANVERVHLTTTPRSTPAEHDDIDVAYRLDRVPAGFADQPHVTDVVNRLGALGYPTLRYVMRAPPCRAAADAATVDAVRRALAGGPRPNAVVVGAAIVRHGACGESVGVPDYAWWNHAVDASVRIDVTARVYR